MDEITASTARLWALANRIQLASFERSWAMMEREHWSEDRDADYPSNDDGWMRHLATAVAELDAALPDVRVDDEIVREFREGHWSLGSKFQVLAPRAILCRFLVPVREVPSGVPVTMKLFAFLGIAGERDWLVRENHGFGIHYHYVLADKRRTTTMICWDTRWQSPVLGDQKGLDNRPIFHQLHNDRSKKITASPGTWGEKKRKSMRNACVPDLRRQNVTEFLCAASDATSVWPVGLRVTPRP